MSYITDQYVYPAGEKRPGLWRFFTYTKIETRSPSGAKREYWVNENPRTVRDIFDTLVKDKPYRKGEPFVRGFTDTGDHVFVDKISYHFRKPRRGEVFVFSTQGIEKMGRPGPPPAKPSFRQP